MNSPLTIFIFVLSLVAMIAQWTKRRRIRRGSKARRRFGGVGPGAIGAVYGMLSEDKRNAIELIVEDKAAAVDPERARDKNLE